MSTRVGIIFALVLFFSALLLLSLEKGATFPVPERKGSALENVRVTHTENGEKSWDLTAARADLGNKMTEAALEDLVLHLKMDNPLRVSGKKGLYRFGDGDMRITEGAVVETADWTLRTNTLHWDSVAGKIRTDEPVTMESSSFRLQGRGLEADTRKEIARVSDVRCTFYSF